MKPIILLLSILIIGHLGCTRERSEKQENNTVWNWSESMTKEQEQWALLTDNLSMKKYIDAKKNLDWLIERNPNLHPELYKLGLIIYEQLINNIDDPEIKSKLLEEENRLRKLMKMNFP